MQARNSYQVSKDKKDLYEIFTKYLINPNNVSKDKKDIETFERLMTYSMPLKNKTLYRGGFIQLETIQKYLLNTNNLSPKDKFNLGESLIKIKGIDNKEIIDRSFSTLAEVAASFVKDADMFAKNAINKTNMPAYFIIKVKDKPVKGICSDQIEFLTPDVLYESEILLDHESNKYELEKMELKTIPDGDKSTFEYWQVVILASGK